MAKSLGLSLKIRELIAIVIKNAFQIPPSCEKSKGEVNACLR